MGDCRRIELPTSLLIVIASLKTFSPIFVVPANKTAPQVQWRTARTRDGQIRVEARNTGSAHVQLGQLDVALAANGDKVATRSMSEYVLPENQRSWMVSAKSDGTPHAGGVDLYIGGSEHAVLHLLYARFWHKVLFDLGEVSTPEPFGRLFHQGMILSFAKAMGEFGAVSVVS